MKFQIISCLFLISLTEISFAQNSTKCQERELFSSLPNHELTTCEFREFDTFSIYSQDPSGNRISESKEGEKSVTNYRWMGEWDSRPSQALIYRNYQNAVEKIGGKLLYSGSAAYFYFEKSGEKHWMEVNTDGSGYYQVTVIREEPMNQYVTLTAKDIQKQMTEEGQVAFYGIQFDTDQAIIKPESQETLQEMANYLKSSPTTKVYLVGHTDNTGSPEHNL